MSGLVLSLFPGIGLLDMAFEQEGFCVVRGPDLLWGGDIRSFHPPARKFDGIIGGPPCQSFSALRHIVHADGNETAPNLIGEFVRCVKEAMPRWFLMENVPGAPLPECLGWKVTDQLVRDVAVGGKTARLRRFSFGDLYERPFSVPQLESYPAGEPTVVAGHGLAPSQRDKYGATVIPIERMCELQGLPEDFLSAAPFTVHGKRKVIGNGVPLPMGRAVAKAVSRSITGER